MHKKLPLASMACIAVSMASAQSNVGIGTLSPNSAYTLHVLALSGKNALLAEAGTFGNAALFRITEASNNAAAVSIENMGSGNDLQISNSNGAPSIIINKLAGSSAQAIYVEHAGNSGVVAQFRRNNASSQGATIIGYSNSNNTQSPVIFANHEGAGDAAVVGRINNAGNPYSAIYGETNGTGPAIYGMTTGSGSTIFANQTGTGRAGQFQIGNAANDQAALRGFTNGIGRAGFFTINNAANAESAIYAETNGTGNALAVSNSANGFGIRVLAGGTRVSHATLTTGTNIATRATAYLISGGGPYTVGFTLEDGELMYFFNNTAATVTVNGLSIPANSGKTCVVLGGTLREM